MKKNLSTMGSSFALAIVLTSVVSLVWADDKSSAPDPTAVMKTLEEAGKPGPEHKKLEPLAGKWSYTSKLWMDPSQPPMESTGTIERHWILGDRFLEERVVGKGPDGKTDLEGRGIIGYDKAQNQFTYTWMCSMQTATALSLGTCDAAGKHFTFKTEAFCPIRNRKVQGRDEIRIESADKHIVETYQIEDGKDVKVMELTAIRTK